MAYTNNILIILYISAVVYIIYFFSGNAPHNVYAYLGLWTIFFHSVCNMRKVQSHRIWVMYYSIICFARSRYSLNLLYYLK